MVNKNVVFIQKYFDISSNFYRFLNI